MTEPTYIEGPISEPWVVNDSGCTIYVERHGCDDRMREVFTPPYEPAFICDQPEQAQALCDRLNALDATRVALLRLADAVEVCRDDDDLEWLDVFDSNVAALLSATKAARKVLS